VSASLQSSEPRRIVIVAGEASGDAHGGRLAAALRALDPGLDLVGMGGEQMRAAGVRTLVDSAELGVMGFAELAGSVRRVTSAYRTLSRLLRSTPKPGLLVLIDFPDFNLRLAAAARRAGVRVLYYVSPQVWAWRSGRIEKIARLVDRMIVLFPFEEDIYRRRGVDARFLGHPLAEEVRATCSSAEMRARLGVPDGRPLVALLPGSREKEIAHILPIMLGAAQRLASRASFGLAKAPGLDFEALCGHIRAAGVDVAIVENDTYNLVAAADAAAVASGTATVECAVLGCPMAVVYRMSPLTYQIARRLVRVPFIAMPNIVLGERVVPELIQHDATPDALAKELAAFLDSSELSRRTAARLAEIRDKLVVPGAAKRAAETALEMLR
jgi:lipid-A-disaccharide synthase